MQVEAATASMKDLQVQNNNHQKEVGKLKGNMAAAATALDAVRSNRRNLLEQATLEQVWTAIDMSACKQCFATLCTALMNSLYWKDSQTSCTSTSDLQYLLPSVANLCAPLACLD